MNIKLNYLYRDGGNYKLYGFEIFSNPQGRTLTEIDLRIRECLIDGVYFDPLKWRIRPLKFDIWDSELDHSWNEFDGLEFTGENSKMSIEDFLYTLQGLKS